MTEATPIDLDAEAAAAETRLGARCTVCVWIDSRPAEEIPQWNALMAGVRTIPSIHRIMVARGFTRSDGAIGNCRRSGHRVPA